MFVSKTEYGDLVGLMAIRICDWKTGPPFSWHCELLEAPAFSSIRWEIYYREVAQSHLTLCNPMDCSPPESSVHGISQARRLEWVAISFSRGSPDPRIEPGSPGLAGGFFTTELPELSVCKIIDHQNIFCTSRYIKFCISQVIVTVFWLANNGLYTTKFHS